MNDRRISDLARFAELQVESKDMDPLYPVLTQVQGDLPKEQALWHSVLYVAYYNIASAHLVFQHVPEPWEVQGKMARLPTGVERRGLRGGEALTRHIESWLGIVDTYGSLSAFVGEALTNDAMESWNRLQRMLRLPYGNGRWAAYKTGEVFMKVNGIPVKPTNMGNDFSTGPRQGLALFFDTVKGNGPAAIRELDNQGELLRLILQQDYGILLPVEELETALCDFHALTDGRYYVGKDIDDMQAQLIAAEHYPHDIVASEFQATNAELWAARMEVLPAAYLGELHLRDGVDSRRLTHYARTGEILSR